MKVRVSREETYIPKWNGNDKLKADEQIRVTYKLMTPEQEEQWSTLYFRRDDDDFRMDVETHANAIWKECVVKVEGLLDENGKMLSKAAEVLKVPGIYGLVTEVVAQIKRGITEEERKN